MSSVKSFILDYGLPGLAMVGAGLVTFMLTGGPEEFPSADPDDGVGPAEQDEDFDSNNESNEADEGIMSSTASAPPKWAEELSERSGRMAEELRLLKEASQAHIELQQRQFTELMHSRAHLCGTCRADLTAAEKTATAKKSANNENANENETSSIKDSAVERKEWAEEDWMHNLCAAVWLMATLDAATVSTEAELCDAASLLQTAKQCITQSSITATTPTEASTTVEKQPQTADLAAACELLVMYINNILKNPSVPRYRRVSTTNSSYMKSLLPVEAQAVRVLHAVGFVKKAESTYYEYSWHSLPAAASGSSVDKVSAGKEGAAGSTIDRVPGSAEVATKLLHSAVSLLTALKTRKTALAEVLVQRLTASSASTTGVEGDSGSTSGSQQVDSAGEKVAVLVGGAANVHTTINSKASVTAGPGAISGAGEDGLIAVMEVGEEGVGLLSGNSALDDGVDFMKILKKAQDSQWKPT